MKKLSVIIPVYNSAEVIENTITPILDNATDEVELILVDDGSTDDSICIMNEIRKKHSDISINICAQNHLGVSAARNKGLSLANGEYVYFCDSDDEIDPSLIGKLIGIINNNPDLVIWEHKILRGSREQHLEYSDVNKENLLLEFMKDRFRICMGTFMVKMSTLKQNEIIFEEECRYGEDLEFIIKVILASSTLSVFQEELYTYIRRISSAMGTYSVKRFDAPQMILRLEQYVLDKKICISKEEFDFLDIIFFLKQYVYSLESCLKYLKSIEDVCDFWSEVDSLYPELKEQARTRIRKSSYIPNLDNKFKQVLFRINPVLYSYLCVVRKSWKKRSPHFA